MSLITTKFHTILLSCFSGFVLTNCFSSIFHFRQISKFKKGVTPRKKMESKFPVDLHIYTLCPSLLQSFRKFCWAVSEELRSQTVLSNIFHFGQISKFKKGVTPKKKKRNQNFLWICASTHYVLHYYKVSRNSVERFQRSCGNKKNRTDWLTDGSKTLYPPQLVAWGIINIIKEETMGKRKKIMKIW